MSTRITSTLRTRDFNSIASHYMERPTFLNVETYSDGRAAFIIDVDAYGVGPAGYEMPGDYALRLDPARADAYIASIDKYLEWDSPASSHRTPEGSNLPGQALLTHLRTNWY